MPAAAVTDAKLTRHIQAVEAAGYHVTAVVIGRDETRLETARVDERGSSPSNPKPEDWTEDD